MSRPRFTAGYVAPAGLPARYYVLQGQALSVRRGPERPEVPTGAAPPDAEAAGWLYLGRFGDEACYAKLLARDEAPPSGTECVALRALFGALPDEDFALAGKAMALLEWDRAHRFCGRCGQPTVRSTEERTRQCEGCGTSQYPRLSPAVIGLVERGDEVLLARNRSFPQPFFSCLAGFVEVGETLEEALAREIAEEVGVQVKELRYFGSQPWPFSNSLMLGFHAVYESGELRPDEKEIAEARWFKASALPELPGKLSISRQLIDDFVRRHR